MSYRGGLEGTAADAHLVPHVEKRLQVPVTSFDRIIDSPVPMFLAAGSEHPLYRMYTRATTTAKTSVCGRRKLYCSSATAFY